MYDKYDYVIKSITSKREDGYVNKYHELILGAKCTPGMIEVAYKGALLIDVFNTEDTHWRKWYYTSPVNSVTKGDNGSLIIDTLNSVYVLEKLEM